MKILEIDDEPDIVRFVEMALTSLGHEFASADNGKDGIKMIEQNKYDVVLLDLSMLGFSGIDVIEELVKKDLIKKQKIILFTASANIEANFGDLAKYGIYYLEKPVDIDVLISKISEIEASLSQ